MPYFPRRKFDERQDQIMSGHLNGNVPSGPGYLAWLASKGFTQAQFDASGFVVDVSDSGIDNGSTAPNHFGLFTGGSLTASSRVAYNRLEGFPNGGSTLSGCDGHGNLNAHIVGGFDNLSGVPFADASGYHYGLGVCPFVKVGSSVVFDPDNFTNPDYDNLQSEAYRDGARVSNNSWGGPGDGSYDIDAQNYDMLVRDAQPAGSTFGVDGNQEMVILFAAGNDGSDAVTIGSPGTSKNVISVGASENVQAFGGADLSGVADNEADSANDIVSFSSRGPCADGRHKPDLVAPGTHVSGGAPEAFNPGLTGTVDGCFTGNGVSGGPGTNLFWPLNQQFYTASSGTSHSTPAVAGACALVRQYFINQFSNPPSAAMTKAYLMNSARYLTGASAADNLWSDSQGMGGVALDTAFDGVARVVRDQLTNDMFMASGQSREYTGYISDTNKPFRVTVAWTDAPGSTVGNAYVNNLDLIVTVGGITYKGNVFRGAVSVSGGSADLKNNVESVFLPAGVSGTYTVKVLGTGINGIGVPNVNNALNQDFALVIYNATDAPIPSVQRVSATLIGEGCSPGNGAVDPGEIVTVNLGLQNFAARSTTNLIATLQTSGGVLSPSGPQVYGALAGATVVTRPFTFIANGNCGGTVTATLNLQDPAGATGATNLGTTSFSFKLGSLSSGIITLNQTFDGVTAPALPTGWTATATGVPSTWKTSAVTNATPPNAVFATNATTIGSATLLSPAINITSPAAQLNFRHFYNLEASTSPGSTVGYDGGVLEIAIGAGGFQDIIAAGGSFINGAYNRTISGSYNNPLAGRQAWSGNSPGFVTTTLILPAAAAGQSVRLRWVCGSDESLAAIGWYVDTVTISDGAYSCCAGLTPTTIVNPRRSGNSPVFSFQSINGQTYRVEYKSDLANPVWSSLQTYTGDGSLINVTDSFPVSQRFYRIRSPQ
jgi:hypothetical protein